MPPSPDLITQSISSHLVMSQYPPTLAQTAAAGLATSISILMVMYCGSAAMAVPVSAMLPINAASTERGMSPPSCGEVLRCPCAREDVRVAYTTRELLFRIRRYGDDPKVYRWSEKSPHHRRHLPIIAGRRRWF